MRYVLTKGRFLYRDDDKKYNGECLAKIPPVPIQGECQVLVQDSGRWVGIGNDFNVTANEPYGLAMAGTWDKCYPIFKFACGLQGLVLP